MVDTYRRLKGKDIGVVKIVLGKQKEQQKQKAKTNKQTNKTKTTTTSNLIGSLILSNLSSNEKKYAYFCYFKKQKSELFVKWWPCLKFH